MNDTNNKDFIIENLNCSNNNLSRVLFGKKKLERLIEHFINYGSNSNQQVLQLINSLLMMQLWINRQKLKF